MDEKRRNREQSFQSNEETSADYSIEEKEVNEAIEKLKHDADEERKREEIKNSTIGGF